MIELNPMETGATDRESRVSEDLKPLEVSQVMRCT